MGREIRRVPLNWEHPKEEKYNYQTSQYEDSFIPMHDENYNVAAKAWIEKFELWKEGKHPQQLEPDNQYAYVWDYEGDPPSKRYYLPDWPENEQLGYRLYETVSEGTPVSPAFASLDELAEYLAEYGDFWDDRRGNGGWGIERANAFCKQGRAPSFIMSENTGLVEGKLFTK
jgi:hypothetical protein